MTVANTKFANLFNIVFRLKCMFSFCGLQNYSFFIKKPNFTGKEMLTAGMLAPGGRGAPGGRQCGCAAMVPRGHDEGKRSREALFPSALTGRNGAAGQGRRQRRTKIPAGIELILAKIRLIPAKIPAGSTADGQRTGHRSEPGPCVFYIEYTLKYTLKTSSGKKFLAFAARNSQIIAIFAVRLSNITLYI